MTALLDSTPQARHQRALKTLQAFCEGKHPGPVPNSVWMGHGFLELRCFNNRVRLAAIFVLPENRSAKLGSAYLQELLDCADTHGAEIECCVSPFGEQVKGAAVGVDQLKKWYSRFGFEAHPAKTDVMIRMPAVVV